MIDREAQREAADFYETPPGVAALGARLAIACLAPRPPWRPQRAIDAGAGTGAITRAVRAADPAAHITAVELPEYLDSRTLSGLSAADSVAAADYLWWRPERPVDLVIANPPYRLAEPFVRHSLGLPHVDEGSWCVAMLLRLGFLASNERYEFWRSFPVDSLQVLAQRPGFTGDGGTDNSDYAWFLWGPAAGSALGAIGWHRWR